MKRLLDIFFLIISIVWPIIGVLWFGWDIYEVVFLYAVEAGCMAIYHSVLYWKTARCLTNDDAKQAYAGAAILRILLELTVVLGALTLLVDATVGRRTTVFDHWPVLLQYLWVTAVPLGSVLAHYLPKILQVLQQPVATVQPRHLTPLWLWAIALPLPAFLYSYVLVDQTRGVFIALLLVVALCKAITKLLQFFNKAEPPMQLQPADPLVLQSSVFSPNALLNQLWTYLLILVGFFAVNPFTHDPSYSLTGNALIYFGFVGVAWPLMYRFRRVLRLDSSAKQVVIESGWVWHRQRTIALADIVRVFTKRNEHKIVHAYIFKLRDGSTWKCSAGPFERMQWQAWVLLLQKTCPTLSITRST